MKDAKRIKLDDLRRPQPGTRRILDAFKQIKKEDPGLVDAATLAAAELTKRRNDGGRVPQ
jgi:hypothetical protein